MGFTKLTFIFLSLFFVFCFHSAAYAISTNAKYAILVDYDTSDVLFEKNADEKMIPSSMTKLMTVYIAFKHLDKNILKLEDTFTVSKKAWQKGGSRMFLRHTEKVSINDLLNGIIVQSGNDASIAMAEGISSTEEEFATLMNKTAQEIGLKNTNFVNSTGWPDENHYMSARDIAILSDHIIREFPKYYPLFAKKEFTHANITQKNRNLLLDDPFGVDGLKTGHTEEVGYGLAASAGNNGRRMIAVVNGLSTNLERAAEAKKLLLHGFRYFDSKQLFTKGQVVDVAPVWLGNKNSVDLVVDTDIKSSVPKLADKKIKMKVSYMSPIPAPIKQGDKLATLIVDIPDIKIKEIPLYAGQDIEEAGFIAGLFQKIGYFFSN